MHSNLHPMPKILIIDDDTYVCKQLHDLFAARDYETRVSHTANHGLKVLRTEGADMVFCDNRLPDADGEELYRRLRRFHPVIPVVFMTAYADVRTAVNLIRAGAADYVVKPLVSDEVLRLVEKAMGKLEAGGREVFFKQYVEGKSDPMINALNHVRVVAPTDLSVLIMGETGSGKEVVARAIHYQSKRRDNPFVALDCGALPGELANSELFGHVKGAFTGAIHDKRGCFEEAAGGTLFLDEVGNLSHENQVKLLRTLQEKTITRLGDNKPIKVDVRIIAATNEDLSSNLRNKAFREDLYHRLNGFTIHIPPLRKRKEDVFDLVWHFIGRASKEFGKEVSDLEPEVKKAFLSYNWPGNIRELENVVTRCVLLTRGSRIDESTLPEEIRFFQPGSEIHNPNQHQSNKVQSLKQVAMKAEREAILAALLTTGNNRSEAARLLRVDRKTLYNKMKEYSIRFNT